MAEQKYKFQLTCKSKIFGIKTCEKTYRDFYKDYRFTVVFVVVSTSFTIQL